MYKSFSVENFRGFESISVTSLSRVNLITGQNNVGKTALLEAIFIHSGAFNPELANTINGMRGITQALAEFDRENESPWDSVFHNYRARKPIKLDADIDDEGWQVRLSHVTSQSELSGLSLSIQRTYERASAQSTRIAAKVLKLEFRWHKRQARNYFLIVDASGKKVDPALPTPPFSSRFQFATNRAPAKEEAARFARVQIDGSDEFILNALKTLEPRLKRLTVVLEAGEPMIHGDIGIPGRGYVPLAIMGDGVNRLCNVLLNIASVRDGVLLVDEIDVGWHYSVLGTVWGQIFAALDLYNVQLFCTTHSNECVAACHEAAARLKSYPLALYRLERTKGGIHVVDYDKETIQETLQSNFEMR